jgi:hypothetical protein
MNEEKEKERLRKEIAFLTQRRERWIAQRREVMVIGGRRFIVNGLHTNWISHELYLWKRIEGATSRLRELEQKERN